MVGSNPDPISTRELHAVKIGFDVKDPIAMQTGAAQAAVAVTTTSPGSGADATTFNGAECTKAYNDIVAIVALLNEIRQCLIDVGIIKGSA